MEPIMVSVSCLVYNHEKYLRNCLDGVLAQKTNFRFEVLIHDDASTDGSAAIIREYEEKYPDIIRPIYQTQNQHSQRINIHFAHQYPRARGKYFCLCEGDDFWCDENKLQKQFDIMEAHPECSICVHRVRGVDESGTPNGKMFPPAEMALGVLDGREMIDNILSGKSYPFQTSSYFYKSEPYVSLTEVPEFMRIAASGDVVRLLYLGHLGDVYFMDETMSCYRMNSVGSWSSRVRRDLSYRVAHMRNFIEVLDKFDAFTEQRYHDAVSADILRREFSILKTNFDVKTMRSAPYRTLFRAMPKAEKLCYQLVYYLPFTKGLVRRVREAARAR